MATQYVHTQVSHVARTGRRRSQSVTLPNSNKKDATGLTAKQKKFFLQLQKERKKQQKKNKAHQPKESEDEEDDDEQEEEEEEEEDEEEDKGDRHQPVVSRVPGVHNTPSNRKKIMSATIGTTSNKKQQSSTSLKTPAANDEQQQNQSTVIRVPAVQHTPSTKKQQSSTPLKTPGTNDEQQNQQGITRVVGVQNTPSTKKHNMATTAVVNSTKKQQSSTTPKMLGVNEGQHQPGVIRVTRTPTGVSLNQQGSYAGATSSGENNEAMSLSYESSYSEENEQDHKYKPQIIKVPRRESTTSLKRQRSIKTSKNSNVNITHTSKNNNTDPLVTLKGIYLNSSEGSSIPFVSSSTNLMSKSEIFDQDFHLGDDNDHTKHHGKINISGRQKSYGPINRSVYARSSASLMTAIIAIIIGTIAFAFGLTSLILVLLLRSTVDVKLGLNSTSESNSTSGSGLPTYTAFWQTACSNYTPIDDSTRSINAPGQVFGCDYPAPFNNQTGYVWVRFEGTGGTQLPLVSPGMKLCGSESTGYYDGTMPGPGEVVNGTACFTYYTSVCRTSQMISVANCDSFYTYFLPPVPTCMTRYCTI